MNRRSFLKAAALVGVSSGLMTTQFISPANALAAKTASSKMKIGIFLFDDVEVLDFAGPFEVFSIPFKQSYEDKIFDVITISETGQLIKATNGLQVQPDYSFATMPPVDVLIIPGGLVLVLKKKTPNP